MKIQLFGQRCSGTNYLESLIASNFPGTPLTDAFGFKHFFPQLENGDTDDHLFVVVYRHPVDWIASFYRTPWHAAPALKKCGFSDFIRSEWWSVWDKHAGVRKRDPRWMQEMPFDRDPETGERFGNVLAMRTAKIRAWQDLEQQVGRTVYFRFEDLREDPRREMSRLAEALGEDTPAHFLAVETYKGSGSWFGGLGERLKRRARPAISAQDMEYIVTSLDRHLEASIGYDLPPP